MAFTNRERNFRNLPDIQKELWLENERLPKGHPGVSTGGRFEIHGSLNVEVFKKAVANTLKHDEALSATFTRKKNRDQLPQECTDFPIVVINQYPDPDFEFIDISHFRNPRKEASIQERLFINRPFHPIEGQLCRFRLLKLDDSHYHFLSYYFHVIIDGINALGHFNRISQSYDSLINNNENLQLNLTSWSSLEESEANYKQSKRYQRDRDYWKAKLNNTNLEFTFPVRPGFSDSKLEVDRFELDIPREISDMLSLFSETDGIRSAPVLLALEYLTLAKTYDLNTVTIYVPVRFISSREANHAIGYTVNVIPLSLTIDQHGSFRELIRLISTELLQIIRHDRCSWQSVVRDSNIDLHSDPRGITTWNQLILPTFAPTGTTIEQIIPLTSEHEQLAFGVYIVQNTDDENYHISVNYSKCHFTASRVKLHFDRYFYLLEQCLHSPDKPLYMLDYLLEEEKKQLQHCEMGLKKIYDITTVCELIEKRAEVYLDNIAVIDSSEEITYRELIRRVHCLASFLISQGIQPGDSVAVVTHRHPRLAETILGIMKSGAVYVPITTDMPEERVLRILDEASARYVIIMKKGDETLYSDILPWVNLADIGTSEITNYPEITPEDTAYIIFTSGSTGRPKGVRVPHKAIINTIHSQSEFLEITPQDRILQFASPSFDASLSEIFMALFKCASLFHATRELIDEPWQLRQEMENHKISVVTFPPSYLRLFDHADFKGLRVLLTAGEAPILEDVQYYSKHLKYVNAYGPTEAAICAAMKQIAPEDNSNVITLGRPTDNTRIMILDSNLKQLPPGIPGEICLSGSGLAKGYLDNSQTEKSFVNSHVETGLRIYRTGDIGLWTDEGELFFIGRKDSQVKIHGHRVELHEIEFQLLKLDAIHQAVVLYSKDENNIENLIAFYVPAKSEDTIDPNLLRDHLRQTLPVYMIPSKYVKLDTIHTTVSGKIDSKLLLQSAHAVRGEDKDDIPNSPLKENFRAILSNVFGESCREISFSSDLYMLGTDSIKLMRLGHQISEKFNVDFPFREIMKANTIKYLFELVVKKINDQPGKETASIGFQPIDETLALTESQRQLWTLYQMDNNPVQYTMPLVLRIETTGTKLDAFLESLTTAINSQPVFHLGFYEENDHQYAKFHENTGFIVEKIDYSNENESEIYANRKIREIINRRFDLEKPPLIRCSAIKTAMNLYSLVISIHHIAGDGQSLFGLLDTAFAALEGKVIPHIPLSILASAGREEIEYLNSRDAENDLTYFKALFTPEPVRLSIFQSKQRLNRRKGNGDHVYRILDKEIYSRFSQLASQVGTTPLVVWISLVQSFLSWKTGSQDISVAVPVSTRNRTEYQSCAGYFVNTTVIRTSMDSSVDFFSRCSKTGDTFRQVLQHSQYPFLRLVSALEFKRDVSRSALVDIMVTWSDEPPDNFIRAGLSVTAQRLQLESSKFDAVFLLRHPENHPVEIVLEYDTDLAEKSEAETLINELMVYIKSVMLEQNTAQFSEATHSGHIPDDEEDKFGNNSSKVLCANHEIALRNAWASILGSSEINQDSNFFFEGGDSIKAIRIVSKLRSMGFSLTPAALFEIPRFGDMVKYLERDLATIDSNQPDGNKYQETKKLLNPVQRWLIKNHPDHWRDFFMSAILEIPSGWKVDQLEQCLNQVVQRHPILGRSFINDDEIDDPGRQQPDLFWQVFNHDTSEELFELFESTAEKMTKWITPEEGKLFSCSLIKCDSQNYLMIIGHHLVLDAVSFEIIIEEIEDWFSDTHFQFKQDTEFDRWAEELSIYPLSEFAEIERQYWKKLSSEKIISNPEFIHKGNSKSGKRQTIATSIDITYNFNPLGLNSNHRYGLLPIILSSFSSSLSKFIENGNILIQLEGHGRSIESTGSSAGDAVGWFTAPYPFLLPVRESSKQNVRNIETALSEVPNGGSTFGSLYPLGRNELNLNPKIAFNFIHAFKESTHDNSITLIDPYSLSENWINLMVPTDFGSDQPLEALVTHDNHSIHLSLTFNSDQVDDGFAQSLLNHWKNQLLTILAENEDVYQHEVQSGHDIESISRQIGIEPEAIESIYPLTSTQEGMFFQSRLEGEKSTSYTEQIQFRIAEKLDTNLLEKAWNDVLARHEGLRARFVGMESGEVLQVILSHSFQPITIVDISNYSESDSEDEALKILEKWQHKTYDLTSDSLIHFLVISTRENETLIAWNCHHILIDGWCIGLLLEDLFNIYNQLKKGRNSAKEKTPGLAPYFQWLKEKKLDTSKIWWQNKIGSIKKSSPIVQHMVKEVSKTTPQYYEIQLQDNQTKKLVDRSREAGLSLPVIIQCAWAAVLGKLNNSTDVVFGLVTLGRPFEIHGLEKTVGNFIHTLPMRVQFAEDELFTDAAKRILDDTFAMQTHEALPLADIFNYNPIGTDLFDHILDFHPLATADVSGGQIPEIVEIKGFERIPYPFAVNIVSGNQLTLRFLYNSDLINRDYVEFIAEEFSKALIIAGKSDVVTMRELVSDDLNAKIRKSAYRPESTISTIPEVQSLVNAELVSEIINLFREVLKVEDIAPTDNFIELGGHSLTALRVLLKLEGCFGIKLELNDFFKSATAESVAQLVEYAISTNTVKNSSELLSDTQSDSNREEFQMSTSQERLWFLQMMAPDSGIYNIFYALRLTGDLYISALERAIEYLILRHSSLRIRVPENISQAENLKLRYASHQSRKLKIIDLSHDESPNHLTEDAINQSIRTPFKFGWDQDLFRIELYKLNANEHVLVLVLHHIIMDGWSAEILNTELGEAYTAFKDGKNPGLPEIQFSFNHFVTQQRLLLESEAGKEMRSRWISRFTPLPDQLELPVDFSRPKIRQNQGAVKIGIIEDGLREKIVEYAKSNSTTIFPVLLTAVKILLARLSSNEDIVTGIPVSGRSFANFENVVGCFINTVPLRNRIDQDITFNKLIHVISSTLIDAIQDQQYPFETLVDDLNLPRDPSRNPLFDILVSFQDSENWKPSFSELKGESFPVSPPYSKFDLSFYFFYDADKITIQIEYATDLFKHFTIETILGSFKTLLVKLLELPETPLKYIPILSENETNQVIDVFNRTEFIHPIENTLGKLLKDSFDKHCNNIALRSTYGSTTYPDLYEKSVRVAQTLITKGIKPGNPVFVCLNRSIDLMAAVIGVQLAGAVYVPVDSAIPSSRLKFMVDDLGKGIVLTENEYSAKFQDLPVEILATKDIFLETDVTSIETLTNASPDDLAYIIFTSGSTGLPKGVAIEHRSLLNRLYWMQRTFNLRKDDVLLLKTSISFDVSIWELFWWSISGASLALLPTNGEREPGIIVDEIERHKVTVMHFVPSMLRIFLEILEKTPSAIERIKSLRYVIVSGEELPLDLVSRFNELIFQTNGTELHNLYGPTETTIDVTHQPCSPLHGDIVPIGHPVDNTKIYILDDNMQPVPIGAKGEITVSGVQVARGYVNRDQLTTKKFVANPFGKSDRLYKTGDYGRWLEDGSIEYLGRIDNQVKIRGFRIELQDIEKALEILPGISRAFVKKEESDGLSRLDAFLFPEPGETLDADQIRSALTDSIPEYMIPNRFLLIEDIPYTSSGKVNRKQLRGEPLSKRAEVEKREYSPVEKKLLELWKRILPDADIGLHDTFFEAGGDSLRLIRLHEAIEKVWPGKFTLAELFSYTSIQDQAAIISKNVEDFPEKIIAKRENENSADEPIAIIGMAVRLADFDDLDSFWDDLLAGADRVREFPAQRKNDLESISNVLGYDTEEYDLRVAAYIDDVASFDHARFRLAPVDASMMDPEQRIFQETAVHALENAGYGGDALENASVGVFVGSSPTATFRDAVAVAFPDRLEQGFVLNVPSNIATRLSYLKNWNGPAGLVDTACSSALNAVHLAIRALHQGDCRVALVGGVKVMHLPVIRGEGFTIDSTSGRTHAFDVSADGTGSGEGAVAFLLKPLSEAMHDGDAIHALLLGSAVNQDGHSSGIAAPNPSAQAEVIKSALKKSKIKTSDLNFIEAHGTGTALGDPIEIQGITSALKRNKKNKLAIGSVKGNYGHLDAAAGALGLAKAVLCLKHGIFPKQPFYTSPNPRIDFDRAPVFVPTENINLVSKNSSLKAGVSSFGLSGVNAHIILESPPKIDILNEKNHSWFCIPFSASSDENLYKYITWMSEFFAGNKNISLQDTAFTLAQGRDHLACRAVICSNSIEGLNKQLLHLLVHWDEPDCKSIRKATVQLEKNPDIIYFSRFTSEEEAENAAEKYTAGYQPAWQIRTSIPQSRRLHLPSVPFERTRCWPLFKPALKKSQISRLSSSFLGQPLTTSRGTYYPLNLTAEAFWPVSEHKVNGTPTLVGMGWIAILYSGLVEKSNNLPLKLSNLIWLKPFQPSNMKKDTLSLELNREANSANAKLTGQTLDGDWHVYAEAVTSRIQIKTVHKDLEKLKKDLIAIPFDEQDDQNGLVNVGKRWHCRKNLWISEDGFRRLAELVLPDDFKTDIEAFPVHPALLDVAVSLAIEVDGYLPAACGRVLIHAPLEPHVFALSTTHAIDSNRIQSSCKIFSTAGKLLIEFSDMIFLRLAAEEIGLHEIKWEERHNTGNESIQFTDGNILVSGIEEKISRFRNQTNLCDQTIEFIALSAENANFHELVGLIKEKSIRKLIILAGNGEESSWYTAELIKNLMHAGTKEFFQVLIVGSGVAKLASDKENVNPDAGLQAGLAASANWEDDQIAVKYLDIDSTASLSSLVNEFKSFSSDNLHSISLFRNGKYYDRQIIPLENKPGEESGINNTGHGTIVITGGQGAMGSALARAFAEWGILRIALLDLSKTDENSSEVGESSVSTLTWLQLKGIEVRQYSCDVTDKHDLGQTLDKIRSELGKITGIIHTAGVSGGGFLLRKEKEEWDRVLAPKVIGTRNLHELTQNDPVILFVLASSRTAITGAPGQTDYAAANAFLDSFAQYRRSLGLPALAIDWATWEGEGMAARSGADSQSSDTVKPEDAAGIISNSLKSERAQVVVTGRKQRPVYDTFTKQASESEIDQQFINEVTLESIGSLWKEVLGYDRVIQPEEDFFELGGDSITGMQLISRIQKETGQPVSLADLFSNSSLESFSEVLVGKSDQEHEQVSASDVKYFPILWEQAGILHEASLHDTGTAFNLPLFLRLPDVINEDRLTGALNDLIKRHEILRTRFELHGESFKMIVLPSIEYSLPMEFHDTFDLDKLSLELIQPFDLSELPLFRAKLIKYKTGERVFYFDIHHSLADATSLDILMGDLAAFYQHQELPALPIQLKDLSLQRTSEEEKNKDEEARRYWLKKYQDNLPKLDLPGDYPRPNVHTYRGDVVEFEIGQELTNDLRRVARKYGTTTFNLFLTTWSILLYKYTEQTDIVIATALDERDHPDLMQMPGMLISLLPIRFEMSRSINIEDLIKRNHKSISEAIKYRGYNLIRLLSELMPPAAPERMTLMEIMFSYMNGRRGTLENSVWSDVQNLTPEKNSSKADISIFGTEFQSNITFILEYYSDLFSESRMKRMGEHLVNLLQQVVTIESTMSIASMELTNEIERRRLANFNRGFVAIPVSMTVHSLVLEQAELHPDAIALTDKNGSISYQMLAENAKRVASNLIKMNVLPGDFVAVTATRETATIISFLGIMIAGCAYLPLDTEQPENRIKLILKDANCRVLIANDPEIEKCSPSGCTMIHTDQLLIDNSCEPSAFPVASGDDPAYLIYTSGSTGVPKGVVVPHRGVYRLTKLTPEIEIFPEDCVFQGGNLAFDVSTWEIWGPLSNGARGVLVEKEELVEKSAIRNLIQKYGISVMWLTTSLGNSFAEVDPGGFAGLRMFITGGEKLSVEHIRRIHVASPDLAIYNGYGPTENTTFTSIHKVVPEDLNGTSIPIGIPIANTSVYILDSNGKSVPIGIWGELCTGGDGVAIGYWKDHELTAKRFIQNPLNPEERIYKTGDYARWREDGVLEFLGRRDGQVKLRGFRVETGEIEEKIRQIEGIHNAVVIVRQDEQEKMLAAFIVSDAKIDLDIVLEALHQKLPGYMIPARFVQVDEIPLTSNGKADRKKLISILDQKSSLVSKNARAGKLETTNEKLVAELFKELLKIDEVGPESNFMELGGHSLMIFRLINRIAEKTGQRLAIRDVMKTSSVRKLALLLENIPVTDDDKIMPVIPANSYPLSHAQQRLFMQHQLEGADSAYNMPMLFEFGEKFNPEIFRKVLNRVCERHNAFKTAFHDNDGKLNQTIQDSIILPFEVDDLRQLANPREEALRLIRNELRKPFDLAKPPLLRVRICQTGEDSYLCSLCMHHIIGDGWSVRILFSEIGELYGRFETGQDLQLETLSIQYHDYAVWQMTRNWEKASKYWQQKLETSAAKLEIPYDYPAPAQRSYRGATEQIMVSQDLYRAITRTVKARGITLATFGLGMFAAILYRLTRQDDFIIGLGIAGRERKELEGIIGFFVNLLPVRIQMTDDMEVDELLQKVHQTVQDAMELQDYPFDLLVRDINTSGSKRRDTFINIVFEYQRFEGVRSLDELPEALKTRELNDDELNAALSNTAKYDITLFMIEEKENLLVRAEYDTDLFAGKTIHDWLDAYIQFLQMASISDDEDAHS